jgi:hypothetical protein
MVNLARLRAAIRRPIGADFCACKGTTGDGTGTAPYAAVADFFLPFGFWPSVFSISSLSSSPSLSYCYSVCFLQVFKLAVRPVAPAGPLICFSWNFRHLQRFDKINYGLHNSRIHPNIHKGTSNVIFAIASDCILCIMEVLPYEVLDKFGKVFSASPRSLCLIADYYRLPLCRPSLRFP